MVVGIEIEEVVGAGFVGVCIGVGVLEYVVAGVV